jgi:two-component system response regulator AtoC
MARSKSKEPRVLPASHGHRGRVLVVDDAEGIRHYLASLLELRGFAVDTAEDGRSALALIESGAAPDVILLDVMMPGLDGLETLRRLRARHPEMPVVMLSVVGKAATIVEAMQLGAADYLNKPFEEEELEVLLMRVLDRQRLENEREKLRAELEDEHEHTVWKSEPMRAIREIIEQTSDTDVTVLIQGESGVGKEIIARTVHELSNRANGPFVKVNCAALPEDLLESELFGYEKGAFTGAHGRKYGKFEVANKGTIFLDEIGEMSPGLQAKLLQVLQDSEFTRLGGHREVRVDVRVVCATHRPLLDMVQQGQFREDLYFRLNVVNVQVPPLRERIDELADLVETFLDRYSVRYDRPRLRLSPDLMRALERHPFPGNVRELENMIKRAVVLESEDTIRDDLARAAAGARRGRSQLQQLLEEIEETAGDLPLREVGRRFAHEAERETIEQALHRTQWNRKQAAKLLNVSYKTLLQKIRDCGLEAS